MKKSHQILCISILSLYGSQVIAQEQVAQEKIAQEQVSQKQSGQEENNRVTKTRSVSESLPNAPPAKCKFPPEEDCALNSTSQSGAPEDQQPEDPISLGGGGFSPRITIANKGALAAEESFFSLNVAQSSTSEGQQPEGQQSSSQVPSPSADPPSATKNNRKSDPTRGWAPPGMRAFYSATPPTLGQEFFGLAEATIGPRALFITSFSTGLRMANPKSHYPPEWRQGAQAFGRNFGDHVAVLASTQSARFLTGALMHEDLRYKPSTSKNPFLRTAHAITFTFVDKTNSGHSTLALSNFTGAAAGGFVGNAYLPSGFNNLTHAESRMAFEFGGMAAKNILAEYSPEIMKFARKIHLPRLPIPEWWTPNHSD